ncbi:MAG: hypothetical protein JSU68_13730 [Phycisphaerales bacterium]|nr:MAG: hypothetical protein JSU68_13730 [Phycisphaerales bacterium]
MIRVETTTHLLRILCLLLMASVTRAQVTMDWYTFDGGGTMECTGGDEGTTFELSGTVGQPDAIQTLIGGEGSQFELTGGFWFTPVGGEPSCVCGDIDQSGGGGNLGDFATFAVCYGLSSPNPPGCDAAAFTCSDMDGDGTVTLSDFATFATFYGLDTTYTVPDCVLP